MEPITSGSITITGDFTKAQAQQLVDGLVVR
jgi:preprotein translocase subunit SecD